MNMENMETGEGNPEGSGEADQVAKNAEELLEEAQKLRQTADSIKINPKEKVSEQADLVHELIEERTALGPQISGLIEQSEFLQSLEYLPGADEEERASQLSEINETISNLQKNAGALEKSIDVLASNPYIKKELEKKAGLTGEIKEEIKIDKEFRDDHKLEQKIKKEYEQRIETAAQEVVVLLKKIRQTERRFYDLEHNVIEYNRSDLLKLIRSAVKNNFREKKRELVLKELNIIDSESALTYKAKMESTHDQKSGFGSGKYKKAITEILESKKLKKMQEDEEEHERLKNVSFDADFEQVGSHVEALMQEINDEYQSKFSKKSGIKSVMGNVKQSFFGHLDRARLISEKLRNGDNLWYDVILKRPGIKKLARK